MNLRVFYLTRRGISDGYPQMRLHLAQEATKKRHSLKSLNYHHVTHH